MKLKSFRVQNFRSINNSGVIRADEITALVGRNESGKSNLLLALASLNPPEGRKPLSKIKDFPRHRRLEECTDETRVLTTTWKLEPSEREELGRLITGGANITEVEIGRYYENQCWVGVSLTRPSLDSKDSAGAIRKLRPHVEVLIERLVVEAQPTVQATWTALQTSLGQTANVETWATEVTKTAAAFRKALIQASVTLPNIADEVLASQEENAEEITNFDNAHTTVRNKIVSWLPIFIYIAEFPELDGHQNVATYLERKNANPLQLNDPDLNFEKMAKVSGFDPKQLQKLLQSNDHETRNQLVNRAGAVITAEMRRLWKDRQLKVRFNLDGNHLETLISDPNNLYDVEVNLDERSRGFKWFFSFYISFAADTQGGNADGAILLLDEPGLYLHATSQADLLKHLREDFKNQIIYTTHSPFMVPSDAISVVRTVNISQDKGTEVTNDPTGDSRTLFPLQAALGYHLSQTLFIGSANLVVEGVTDFWFLSSVNAHLRATGKPAIPDELVITPAGGAPRVPYMVALLTAERLDVIVLLDDERAGRDIKNELLTTKLIRDSNIIFVSEGFAVGATEADIEDLIDADIYEALVRESYKVELKRKKLTLNPNIPRIVKRFEDAFKTAGLDFQKTRPARLFMTKVGSDADAVLTHTSVARFEKLFQAITNRFQRHKKADREPFR